ncbi:uncharacterized protein PHALS_09554 [Plasmopara halstedii]|uniref:Uncharacterized protein n=1 Tax=Plasmopara halstedii TaxID=4781 RepID=A0A0P1A500_PLAHL|nr:uncharacterized protein PHALS_09554 [Plasmopara halstedii]CEG35433.1 hypothetical protein PHALS_09554 [Plasmopara halstedii]|eukprot:XP_024571802.1 hypothetical protein PHALS_09554 [Plasmopara halstedii]
MLPRLSICTDQAPREAIQPQAHLQGEEELADCFFLDATNFSYRDRIFVFIDEMFKVELTKNNGDEPYLIEKFQADAARLHD